MKKKQVNKHRRKGSIRKTLLKLIVPSVLITIIVIVILAGLISGNRMEQMATSELGSSLTNQADSIEAWLDENMRDFASFKHTIETSKPDADQLQTIIDSTYGYNSNSVNGLRIGSADGTEIQAKESKRTADTDVKGSTWYQQGTSSINMHYGEAYKDSDGDFVISCTGMIDDGGDTIRVLAADFTLEKISTIVNSGVRMDGASSMLIDTYDNTILASPDAKLSGTTLGKDAKSALLRGINEKISTMNYDQGQVANNLVDIQSIDGTDWVLVSYVPTSIVYSTVNRMMIILIVIGIIAAALISILISLVIRKVTMPIADITKNITAMSQGDFTIDVRQESNDEIGDMSHSVKDFVGRMREMLRNINDESNRLKNQSDSSDAVSRSMLDDSMSQSRAMKNLNDTVDQLSKAVNEIAQNATTLAMVVSDTRDKSDKAGAAMESTVTLSQKGRDDMEKLSLAMKDIADANDALVASIGEVGSASDEITKIVGVISEIADETNLLSLNASIEAARAGESGKGFAVVASQIGSLATNSADSAENISKLIKTVQELIARVVDQANSSAESIKANTELINTAVRTFDDIYSNIQKSDSLIKDMVFDVDKVNDVASNVAAISEEQAASSDEILKTSENMVEKAENITNSSREVKDNSKELAETSDTLTGYVNKFKI